jgi:hypothetical protein
LHQYEFATQLVVENMETGMRMEHSGASLPMLGHAPPPPSNNKDTQEIDMPSGKIVKSGSKLGISLVLRSNSSHELIDDDQKRGPLTTGAQEIGPLPSVKLPRPPSTMSKSNAARRLAGVVDSTKILETILNNIIPDINRMCAGPAWPTFASQSTSTVEYEELHEKVMSVSSSRLHRLPKLRRFMIHVYESKIKQDSACDRSRTDRLTFAEHLINCLANQTGNSLQMLIHSVAITIASLLHYLKEGDLPTRHFILFLQDVWNIDVLNVFLEAHKLVDELNLGYRVNSSCEPHALSLQMEDLQKCAFVSRTILGKLDIRVEKELMEALRRLSTEKSPRSGGGINGGDIANMPVSPIPMPPVANTETSYDLRKGSKSGGGSPARPPALPTSNSSGCGGAATWSIFSPSKLSPSWNSQKPRELRTKTAGASSPASPRRKMKSTSKGDP